MEVAGVRAARTALCVLLSWMALPGCGILDEGAPETARVTIEGPAGHPVTLVTSSDFDAVTAPDGESRDVSVFSADTAEVRVPYEREYDLGPRTRIYLLAASDSTASSSIRVRVFIDGELRFDRSTRFTDPEGLAFVFASAGN